MTPRRFVACLSAVLLSAGCSESVPELTHVSGQDGAVYTDLAAAKDGTLHLLYVEDVPSGPQELFHRVSDDGGESWSKPVQLSVDADNDGQGVGFARLVVDGQGRAYAVWKDDVSDGDNPAGEIYDGTLVYRALVGGQWSPTVRLSGVKLAYSWFPAVAPDGTAHVVWSEPVEQIALTNNLSWEAGHIQQVTLQGAQASAPRTVLQAPPTPRNGYNHYDGYEALRGYVDAQGRPHFTAVKMLTASGSNEPREIVHFDGTTERKLFDSFRFTPSSYSHFRTNAPALFVDKAGKDHVLIADLRSPKGALLDFAVGSDTPTVVHQLAAEAPSSELRGFQLWPHADGTVTVLVAMHDGGSSSDPYDAFSVRFDGSAWQAPSNVTQNALRDELQESSTEYTGYSRFSARYGAAALVDGELALALVNTEIQTLENETAYASWSATRAYFTRVSAD